jgi:hypothetical protein
MKNKTQVNLVSDWSAQSLLAPKQPTLFLDVKLRRAEWLYPIG